MILSACLQLYTGYIRYICNVNKRTCESDMPGDNCSVFGCGTSRRHKDVGIFQIPGIKKKEWRARFLNAIMRTRKPDDDFKSLIPKDRVFACSRHFHPSEIKTRKYYNIYSTAFSTLFPIQHTNTRM